MYSAQIYTTRESDSHFTTFIHPTIKKLETKIQMLMDAGMMKGLQPDEIREVVVFRGKRKLRIHGYYDWVDGKLKLDRDKPVWFHNIFYGLGD